MLSTMLALVAALAFAGCLDYEVGNINFEPPTSSATPAAPVDDGEPCNVDADCVSEECVQVLPAAADYRGVCRGASMPACVDAIGFDRWSYEACLDLGMTDAVCPTALTAEMQERCIAPDAPPAEAHAASYICCETTFLR